MELQLGPEIILSYKRLAYTPWYAFAEFIDNSTQAYFNNSEELDKIYKNENKNLTISIKYNNGEDKYIEITDNSMGMDENELINAVILGKTPKNNNWRSKYGIGLKTAACWFGNKWTVKTTKYNDDKEHEIEFNVAEIASNNRDLNHKTKKVGKKSHYTIIKIYDLNRNLYGRTIQKIKQHLRSIYRIDMNKYGLELFWQDEKLEWNYEKEINSRLLKNIDNEIIKREFEFEIYNKKVHGWAGVFEKGSRSDAGFSIIQADRIIQGWPSSYRPSLLFGPQEGGRNDLVNQRLVGELFFEGFEVSHTKDAILFLDDEEDLLDSLLNKKIGDLKKKATTFRKYNSDERTAEEAFTDDAISEFESELNSKEMEDFIKLFEIPPEMLIKESNKVLKEKILKKIPPTINVKINNLLVKIYLIDDMSINDPYVITESTQLETQVIVIINKSHPHWFHLQSKESILNYIRNSVYDGVAEWKAYFLTQNFDPETIKLIKDKLLRLPFEIDKNSINL